MYGLRKTQCSPALQAEGFRAKRVRESEAFLEQKSQGRSLSACPPRAVASVSWMPARFVARIASVRTKATGWGTGSRHLQTSRQRRQLSRKAPDSRAWQDACCGSEAHEGYLISSCGVERYDIAVGEGASGRLTLSASERESDILARGMRQEATPRGVDSCFCRTRCKYGEAPCPC
jgi:hypothetical protein